MQFYLDRCSAALPGNSSRIYDIKSIVAGGVKDRFLVPGRVYRDLDGSLIHLVAVEHDLCSWVAVTDAEKNRQVTHRDNFRMRFRSFQENEQINSKKAA